MDPLSVIASVAGIITAASEAIKILGPYVTATKDAPKIVSQVLSEVLAVKTIVAALELFAANLATRTGPAGVQYASLVQVDQLLAVLTDGVLVFSELDALLQTLAPTDAGGSRARLLSSMQWVRKKGTLTTLCTRLQAFKLSINCILSILQSDSQVRAEDHQKQLLSSMDTLLKNNEALALIFLGPDVALAPITWSRRASIQSVAPDRSSSETASNRRSLFALSFEKDLIASRVYRRIRRETMDFSMRSSVARSNGWSFFSGMSLSDISEISVLALPILPSDITNPQHYVEGPESRRAGELSPLPMSAYRVSIFHECMGLEAELMQLTQCIFKLIIERERKSDILATLMSVFRRGAPLLQLYSQLDDSCQDRWRPLLSHALSPSSAKLAVVEFIQACVSRQGMDISDCFTVTDLMDDDATSHIKVIRLVRQITSRLIDAKVIKTVDIDSLPQMQIPKGPPSPQMLAIEELVQGERVYVARLECLTRLRDHILRYHGTVFLGDIDAANDLLSRSRKLIDAQVRFLIRLEYLSLRPYTIFDLDWLQLFRKWANLSKDLYARFSSGEKHAKRALQNAMAFKASSPATGMPEELSNLAGDVIGVLSMPGKRLEKYRAFLEELAHYGDAMFVKEAMDTVDEVIQMSRAAMDDVVREDAKAAFLSSLDTADQSSNVHQYGKLLLYEEVASIDTDIDGSKNDPLALLYLFEKAVLHVALAKKRGASRVAEGGKVKLTIVRIIRGEDLRLISKRGPKSRWLEDNDIPGGGFEFHIASGKIIVHLAVDSRHDKWVEALIQVRDECQKTTRSLAIQNYKLAVVGGMGSGRERFTHQFLLPHSQKEYQSEDWKPPDTEAESRRLLVANETYNLEILGPSVQEAYSAMRYVYMTMCDGFLLIYSVADRNSFEDVLTLQQQILRTKDKDEFPMVLVGNDSETARPRVVFAEEGRAMAKKMGCAFLEADAVTGYKVEEAFTCLAREINRSRRGF